MLALIATGHILGSVILLMLLLSLITMLSKWEIERNQKFARQEMSIELAIPVDELDKAEHQPKIIEFVAHRFSSELLRNRLSDFCGLLQTVWLWIGGIIQTGAFLAIIWYTVADDSSNSAYAWLIVAVTLFFWFVSVIFALTCKLLTGRFPNQAKQTRNMLANIAEEKRIISENHERFRDDN
jgi:hypothetical protein